MAGQGDERAATPEDGGDREERPVSEPRAVDATVALAELRALVGTR